MGSPSVCSHQATGGELYSRIAQSCARLTGQTSGLPQILSYRWCWWLRNAALSYEMQRQLEGTVEKEMANF